jgi:hypothetical protein
MGKPKLDYYTPDELGSKTLQADQSIFTSAFFKAVPCMIELMDWKQPKWDNTTEDMHYWFRLCETLHSGAYAGVNAVINNEVYKIDHTNLAICQTTYAIVAESDQFACYFPTAELVDALQGTRLEWVDLDIFKKLPDAWSLRFPTPNQFRMLLGDGWHSVDDILLYRAKSPGLRNHIFTVHGESAPEPEWEAYWWISQSRDECHTGYQNSSYGSFILKQHTKLEDLMRYIENWSRITDIRLRERVGGSDLMNSLDELEHTSPFEDQRTNAKHFKNAIASRLNYDEEGYKTYLETLRFLIKFAIFANTEQFSAQKMPIPGLKPGKTSKKALEIHEKLRYKWGNRYKIDVPAPETDEIHEEMPFGSHKTPIRHWVEGFFRQQPYGPGRSLRKIRWIRGFWRGTDSLTATKDSVD